MFFIIYASDQPTLQHTIVADYFDEKIIMSVSEDPITASLNFKDILVLCQSDMINGELK